MPYSIYQPQSQPTSMQGPYGQAWNRAFGVVKDYYAGITKLAVKLRWPDVNYASADALGAIGDERLIDQGLDSLNGISEPLSAYAPRVRNAWGSDAINPQFITPTQAANQVAQGIWYGGGTAYGMLTALAVQGYTTANIIQQNGITWSLTSYPNAGAPASNLSIVQGASFGFAKWNNFQVIISPTPPSWTNPQMETSYGVMPLGAVPGEDEITKLRRIINLWRPAHMVCNGISLIISGKMWGFPATNLWGTGVWGGVVVTYQVNSQSTF